MLRVYQVRRDECPLRTIIGYHVTRLEDRALVEQPYTRLSGFESENFKVFGFDQCGVIGFLVVIGPQLN